MSSSGVNEDLKLSYEWIENVLYIYLPECQSFHKLKVKKGKKKVRVEVECQVEVNNWKPLEQELEAPKGCDNMEEIEWKVGEGILTVTFSTSSSSSSSSSQTKKRNDDSPRIRHENDEDPQLLLGNVVVAALVIVALGAYYIFRN